MAKFIKVLFHRNVREHDISYEHRLLCLLITVLSYKWIIWSAATKKSQALNARAFSICPWLTSCWIYISIEWERLAHFNTGTHNSTFPHSPPNSHPRSGLQCWKPSTKWIKWAQTKSAGILYAIHSRSVLLAELLTTMPKTCRKMN